MALDERLSCRRFNPFNSQKVRFPKAHVRLWTIGETWPVLAGHDHKLPLHSRNRSYRFAPARWLFHPAGYLYPKNIRMGRPRKSGERFPSGKLKPHRESTIEARARLRLGASRESDPLDYEVRLSRDPAPGISRRTFHDDLRNRLGEPEAGKAISRLLLDGKITPQHAAAARAFAIWLGFYDRVQGTAPPAVKNYWYEFGVKKTDACSDADRARIVAESSSFRSRLTETEWDVLRRTVVLDEYCTYGAQADLRRALEIVAEEFDIH
jgi:hypothetical protein